MKYLFNRFTLIVIVIGLALYIGASVKNMVTDAWETNYVQPMNEIESILDGDYDSLR